ncbi:substrate-binding domain-containing protein [Rugamonas sp.]|uniref:substrate-binding domain-containing protein n=1 Tax=Rugamonas sp. TaxID=1926287 RepID=UPI0025D1A9C7|nr:substrate-binding domain-containing protein [Rugamonas sp.]
MFNISKPLLLLLGAAAVGHAGAQELKVYGPGGPAPAFKAAAAKFEEQTGIKVKLVAGLTPTWIDAAKIDAEVVYSGSEHMMTEFAFVLGDQVKLADAEPLYVRPMTIVVRAGNPKKIHGFEDLMKPGVKLEVVNGSGLSGAWEDMAGRNGDIGQIRALRSNVAAYAKNSADAKQIWTERPELDAWLTWTAWQNAFSQVGDAIPVEPRYALYRDAGVVVTQRGRANPAAAQFVAFLKSDAGAQIFVAKGWLNAKPSQ